MHTGQCALVKLKYYVSYLTIRVLESVSIFSHGQHGLSSREGASVGPARVVHRSIKPCALSTSVARTTTYEPIVYLLCIENQCLQAQADGHREPLLLVRARDSLNVNLAEGRLGP